jgi:hypothetical protein
MERQTSSRELGHVSLELDMALSNGSFAVPLRRMD